MLAVPAPQVPISTPSSDLAPWNYQVEAEWSRINPCSSSKCFTYRNICALIVRPSCLLHSPHPHHYCHPRLQCNSFEMHLFPKQLLCPRWTSSYNIWSRTTWLPEYTVADKLVHFFHFSSHGLWYSTYIIRALHTVWTLETLGYPNLSGRHTDRLFDRINQSINQPSKAKLAINSPTAEQNLVVTSTISTISASWRNHWISFAYP